MTPEVVRHWVAENSLTESDIDCATAVMLKILDGKCKMSSVDKVVMTWLYDAVCDRQGMRFGPDYHALIAEARMTPDEAMKMRLYEWRVLAETAISRPVMKAFKAMIREQGLFAGMSEQAAED